MAASHALPGAPGAPFLAIGVTAASLAVAQAVQPAFGHSVYLICTPGLLACVAMGGWIPAASGILVAAVGGFLIERLAGLPMAESSLRAALIVIAGLGFAAWLVRRGREPTVVTGPLAPFSDDPANALIDCARVAELNQPLCAVANYLGAARIMIARLELEDDELIEAVTRASAQVTRADGLLRTGRQPANPKAATELHSQGRWPPEHPPRSR